MTYNYFPQNLSSVETEILTKELQEIMKCFLVYIFS